MNNNNINKPVESSQCRRLRRMNILRERKLGHHQWKGLKLKMMQYRKLRDNKRRQEDKVQHRIARVQKRDRHWIEQYRDARRHRNLRLHLSEEELQHVRMQDASGTELHVLILQLNKENIYDKRMHFNTRWHIFHVGIIFMIF